MNQFKLSTLVACALFAIQGAYAATTIQGPEGTRVDRKGERFNAVSPLHSSPGVFRTITVDGDPSDWAGIPDLITDPSGDFPGADVISIKVANDANYVYFLETFSAAPSNYTFMFLDTDMNAGTGCQAYGVGFEFGITIGSALGGPNYIGDARDCAWSSGDFPGALVVAASGVTIEASVPISVLQSLTPGLTGFDITSAADLTSVARYLLASGIPPLGGTTTGTTNSKVICRDSTTGQKVTIKNPGTSWDCRAAGLTVNPGDSILEIITGTAN